MRGGVLGVVWVLSLAALPPAGAAPVVAAAQGTGILVITECPVRDLTLTMAAANTGSGWNAQVVLANPDVLCFRGVPLLSMTGAWDPAAGGCLHGAGLLLCFAPAQPGDTVPWSICRSVEPVCDAAHAFERGTATLLYA